MLPNLPIFAQNGRRFVCYHGNGGWGGGWNKNLTICINQEINLSTFHV